jgi:hypothetical protein
LALIFLVACGHHGCEGAIQPDAAPVSEAASLADASAGAVDAGVMPDGATPLSTEDRKSLAAYKDALARGRTATVAKDYPGAIKAFAEALAARPDDPQVLGEKGYAEHLAGDDEHALADLEQAAASTTDPKLGAQVWFNLGLVEEARRPDDALVDFAHAEALSPSAASRAKIAGRAVCPVKADTASVPALRAKSWVEVARVLAAPDAGVAQSFPQLTRDVVGDADAKQALGVSDKPVMVGKDSFYVVQTGDVLVMAARHVVQVAGGAFYVYPNIGTGMGGRCTYVDTVTVEAFGGFAHVSRIEAPEIMTYVCGWPGDDMIHDCDDRPGEQTMTACVNAPATFHDAFIDPAAHSIVLALEDSASCARAGSYCDKRMITLASDRGGVHAKGLGCDRTFGPAGYTQRP